MRILIVDDHPLTCSGLQSLLAQACPEAQTLLAHSAAEARSVLQGASPPQWIFLDVKLPDDPARLLLGWLRSSDWMARTVLLSADTHPQLLCDALDAGARGFIPKSADPDLVRTGVEAVLAGRVFLPDGMEEQLARARASMRAGEPALSPRQQQVLALLRKGAPNKVIARELGLALDTVKEYVSAILQAYGVSNRLELLLRLGGDAGTGNSGP